MKSSKININTDYTSYIQNQGKVKSNNISDTVPFNFQLEATEDKIITSHIELYPKKWSCILWYMLRDWNSQPYSLIVIHNLTLYWNNIKCLWKKCVVLCRLVKTIYNIIFTVFLTVKIYLYVLYLLKPGLRCKFFLTILRWFLKICITKIYSLWNKAARLITITNLII